MFTFEDIQRKQISPEVPFIQLSVVSDSAAAVCIVEDAISKKQYFQDDEITGWVIWQPTKDVEPQLFHVYRRVFDEDTNTLMNVKGFFQNEPITGETKAAEIRNLLDELSMQVAQI